MTLFFIILNLHFAFLEGTLVALQFVCDFFFFNSTTCEFFCSTKTWDYNETFG